MKNSAIGVSAAALAGEPDLLILDEPTKYLDVSTIEWLENFLAWARLACVFVTHDRAFLRHVARRVFDLDRGRLSGWNCDWESFLVCPGGYADWEREKPAVLARLAEETRRRGRRPPPSRPFRTRNRPRALDGPRRTRRQVAAGVSIHFGDR